MKMRSPSVLNAATALALAAVASGCAGATMGSGVGDRYPAQPPYYAGRDLSRAAIGPVGHFPIRFQVGATTSETFEPASAPGSAIALLLEEMNAYLDGRAVTVPLGAPVGVGTPPDVLFGCVADAAGECAFADAARRDGRQPMRLAVTRPDGRWTRAADAALREADQAYALLITLEIGSYWPRQRSWRGDKEVELGTGYTVPIPWLTALDLPVSTLQLTGVLLDRQGRAIRIGAEGLLARRTHVVLSGLGARALVTDDDVARLAFTRRDDLPGRPLVWEAAIDTLVEELTGRRVRARY